MNKKGTQALVTHAVMLFVGFITLYPLIWLFFSSLKENAEIFASLKLLPRKFIWTSYAEGWRGTGQITYGTFFINTFWQVIPTVLFTIIAASVVGYGFARFRFRLKKPLFILMMSTMMLPDAITIIPRYLLFNRLGWLDTYLPFIVPALFACYPFHNFLMIQFIRGIPYELDEAANIDGYGTFHTFSRILLPLCKPALFSVAIFMFISTWNDFFNSLIYINSVRKYPIVLALRMSLDATSATTWNRILAMSVLSLLPGTIMFFSAQKYFVEGITSGSIKG